MIKYHWSHNPIGFPTDPDDTEFVSPRTPPTTSCAIEYIEGNIHLRNAVVVHHNEYTAENGELTNHIKQQMQKQLQDWLDLKLNPHFSSD